MSDGQQIYHMLRRLAFWVFLGLLVPTLNGCSDPARKAAEQGAIAQAQLDARQIPLARISIAKAIAIRDDILDLQLLRGRIEAAAQSPGSAFGAYSDALALDSANGEALLGVAHYGMQSGHIEESEEATDTILTLEPTQADALLLKGIYNLVHGRRDDALANAEAILAQRPGDVSGSILKARALATLDRSDEALELIENVRKMSGESEGLTRTLLEFYRLKDDGAAMIPQFDALRRTSPGDRALILDEANALYKLGQGERARAFLRALMLRPRTSDLTGRLVTGLWTEYDPEPLDPAALAQFGRDAGRPARKAAARFYLMRNDPARALQALGADPGDADMAALRAQASIAQGRVGAGLSVADGIVQGDKTNCDALLARAQALLLLRRDKEAIIASQSAAANCPQMVPTFTVLARANMASGSDAAAELAFRDGTSRNTQDGTLARAYAAWLERKGNGTRAVAIARRLTNAAPALVSGWRLYLDLCQRDPYEGCADDAQKGLDRAKIRYAVDRRPDEPDQPGLFSRLQPRKDTEDTPGPVAGLP